MRKIMDGLAEVVRGGTHMIEGILVNGSSMDSL